MQATVDNRDIPATTQPAPQVRASSRGRQMPDGVVGHAPRFEEVLKRTNRVSVGATNATVLITGDPHARYFGDELGERSLIPAADARLGEIRFQEWLGQSVLQQR